MSFTAMLNATMDVKSRAIAVDSYGGQSETKTVVYSGMPCRVDSLSKERQAILSRSGIMASHKIFCDGSMTILPEYEIVVGDETYRVVDVVEQDAALADTHHLEILARTPA